VTVRPGDTLWGIASRVAPQRDPRAEIALLQRLNGLHDVALVPGQVLRLR
jgi:LysM repeat protein